MLNKFDTYGPYEPTVSLEIRDQSGNLVQAGNANAHKYTYTVTLNKFRPASVVADELDISSSSLKTSTNAAVSIGINSQLGQTRQSVLSGTFSLSLSGV